MYNFNEPYPVILTKAEKTEDIMNYYISLTLEGYPKEIFKIISFEDIKPDKYFISTYGRIFTIYGQEIFPFEYASNENNIIYYRIELACSGRCKQRKFFIHRLVANAFINKTDEDILMNRNMVNHKYNMDGRCNYVWNLEWSNNSENIIHAINNQDTYINTDYGEPLRGIDNPYIQFGETNSNSRLTAQQVHLICKALFIGDKSVKEAAIFAGLEGNKKDIILIYSIKNGYVWNDISINYGVIPKKQKHNKTNKYRY